MPDWTPLAVLPNIELRQPIDGGLIAIAPAGDERVQDFANMYPALPKFLSQFTTTFGHPLRPALMICHNSTVPKLLKSTAAVSFRDLVSMCVVPYARSMSIVYGAQHRIIFSDWFWLYPWMLSDDGEHLSSSTPAMRGFHFVAPFRGQSSPELSPLTVDDFDTPLFEALMPRWKRHYLGRSRTWADRALFRSLNMATQAAQMPGGIDTTLYDLGRMIGLWVSAFEILARPKDRPSDKWRVFALLEKVRYLDRNVRRKRYLVQIGRNKSGRRALALWLYERLYDARNAFLHGNPLARNALTPASGARESLFILAAPLYRLALTGFLDMPLQSAELVTGRRSDRYGCRAARTQIE